MGEFRSLCAKEKMTELAWPQRDYVVQVARFDPSKGIPNVVDSYAKFRKLLETKGKLDSDESPQLLICGHGAVDDPDASIIYDQVLKLIHSEEYSHLVNDIVVMRVPPSDQRTLFFSISRVHLTNGLNSSQCAYGQLEDRVTVVFA
jgi:glycosyltransferase involved in cell wall biosynthesis